MTTGGHDRAAVPEVIGVYVHLPWCVRKCPYCDFNSHVAPGQLPERRYVDALIRDLQQDAGMLSDRRVGSVFLGGGTPSLFAGDSIAMILGALGEQLELAPDAEITLEANPGAVEAGRFEEFRRAGVNRLSLGAQSFADPSLQALGRIHSAAEIDAAIGAARAAGFDRINLDLMYGLPGQTVDAAVYDIDQALAWDVAHISHYQLTLEPDTHFFRFPPALPGEDAIIAMEQACRARLQMAGYVHYEVSAFARPGFRAIHNLNYWRFGDYLVLFAGAHSKITIAGRPQRSMRRRNPTSYMRHAGTEAAVVDRRDLCAAEVAFEYMLNRLRLLDPLTRDEFESTTGLPFATIQPKLAGLRRQKLMTLGTTGWSATPRGRELLNEIIGRFLPEPADLYTITGQAVDK
jgi:oxygen-independent coproporphyrinogen-3 oxidase